MNDPVEGHSSLEILECLIKKNKIYYNSSSRPAPQIVFINFFKLGSEKSDQFEQEHIANKKRTAFAHYHTSQNQVRDKILGH